MCNSFCILFRSKTLILLLFAVCLDLEYEEMGLHGFTGSFKYWNVVGATFTIVGIFPISAFIFICYQARNQLHKPFLSQSDFSTSRVADRKES